MIETLDQENYVMGWVGDLAQACHAHNPELRSYAPNLE